MKFAPAKGKYVIHQNTNQQIRPSQMSTIKKAFNLLNKFPSLSSEKQKQRIEQIEVLIKKAEKKEKNAVLVIRELDQLRKQHAYMLTLSGDIDRGLKEIKSLVSGYDDAIANLHDEAAFQLSEAATAAFIQKQPAMGNSFASCALVHAAQAKRISRTLLRALDQMQKHQESL